MDAGVSLVSVWPSERADVGRLLLVSVGGLFLRAELVFVVGVIRCVCGTDPPHF